MHNGLEGTRGAGPPSGATALAGSAVPAGTGTLLGDGAVGVHYAEHGRAFRPARQRGPTRQQRRGCVRPARRPAGGPGLPHRGSDGRFEQLLQVLHPEVKFTVHTPNGTFITLGATEVATRARVAGSAARGRAATVNGRPAVISWSGDGTPPSLLAFTVSDGHITEITAVVDPAKLALMDLPDPGVTPYRRRPRKLVGGEGITARPGRCPSRCPPWPWTALRFPRIGPRSRGGMVLRTLAMCLIE